MKDHVRSSWTRTVLVCGKCSRKLDGGFGEGGDRPLVKVLRHALGGGKGRKATAGVVEVGCLGVCPKRAVMVVDAAHPGEWMIVPEGADTAVVVARLTGGGPTPAGQLP